MSDDSRKKSDHDFVKATEEAVANDSIPHLHCNGFVTALSASDVLLVIKRQNLPVATVTLSYTTAKTLVQKLGALIANLENVTGNKIMTIDEIQAAREREKEQANLVLPGEARPVLPEIEAMEKKPNGS